MAIINTIEDILLKQITGLQREQIQPNAELVRDLGADSLDRVHIVFALEEEFGIEVDENDIEGIKTVEDLYLYVQKKKAQQ
jgi:acyl carrier protein